MNKRKKFTIIGSIIVACIVLFVGQLLSNESQSNKVIDIANDFTAPSTWILESDNFDKPGFCPDSSCPQVYRVWNGQISSFDEFKKLAIINNQPLELEEADCFINEKSYCTATARIDNVDVVLQCKIYIYPTVCKEPTLRVSI